MKNLHKNSKYNILCLIYRTGKANCINKGIPNWQIESCGRHNGSSLSREFRRLRSRYLDTYFYNLGDHCWFDSKSNKYKLSDHFFNWCMDLKKSMEAKR